MTIYFKALIKRSSGSFGRALIRTFLARGLAAAGSLALLLVVGHLYGPEGAGVYAIAYSILLGTGILARTGMDNALMRYVGQDPSSPNGLLYLRWGLLRAGAIALILSLLILIFRVRLDGLFGGGELKSVLIGMALATPAYVFGLILAGFFKGIRMPATASLLDNGIISFFAAAFLLLFFFAFDLRSIYVIGLSYGVAAWVVGATGCWVLYKWCKAQVWWNKKIAFSDAITMKDFCATSNAFFSIHLASFLYMVIGILVAGFFLSNKDLGLVKAAHQIAALIGFVLIVINSIVPPRFAKLYHDRSIVRLGTLARRSALLGVIVASPMVLICLFFPNDILSLFGPSFKEGANFLRVIAVAQLVNVATGSVALLLSMTGHEKLMRNIALLCSAIGFSMFFLTPVHGAYAAAAAIAFVMVAQNIIALYYVWKKLGIWTLPTPNLLKILKCSPEREKQL